MPWVIPNPTQYIGHPKMGEGKDAGECAVLAQWLLPRFYPQILNDPEQFKTEHWRPGKAVAGHTDIQPGTVIATFKNNRYTGLHDGTAHTALYVRQSSEGMEVVHQHRGIGRIQGALIRFRGPRPVGHKSGVRRLGGTLEDDIGHYHVVEIVKK
jgi:hypothetical protein